MGEIEHRRALPGPRKFPVQARSRQRMEQVMIAARELILEHGSDGLRMNDVATRAGISIGSLYQYFPDKTSLLATLAQTFYDDGRACVVRALDGVGNRDQLSASMKELTREYYGLFRNDPAMLDIWSGMQADKVLRDLDHRENEEVGLLIADAIGRIEPGASVESVRREGMLVSTMIASAVLLAVCTPDAEGQEIITSFEAMLERILRA
jgi:AcrR family transcriptional regulator